MQEKFVILRTSDLESALPDEEGRACYRLKPGAAPMPGCFVLNPATDPTALAAVRFYARNCHPALAQELKSWISYLEGNSMELSETGKKNLPHLKGA